MQFRLSITEAGYDWALAEVEPHSDNEPGSGTEAAARFNGLSDPDRAL
ncbi:hypothetical protein [Teichococcus oryzae]|nr:hypothetical protein [Pseudoroseomonas oryzae]